MALRAIGIYFRAYLGGHLSCKVNSMRKIMQDINLKFSGFLPLLFFFHVFYASAANSLDFNIRGIFETSFGYGQNGKFVSGNNVCGFAPGQDNFEAKQKVSLQMEVEARENLDGTLYLDIGDIIFGQAASSGALDADGKMVEVGNAFVDWAIPEAAMKFRMGLQSLQIPALASGNSVFNGTSAAIAMNWQPDPALGFTLFWARPYNDNYPGKTQGFLDNVDAFAFSLPFRFNYFNFVPWIMYASISPNSFRAGAADSEWPFGNFAAMGGDAGNVREGLFPVGGARHFNFGNANTERAVSSAANALWVGFTGRIDTESSLRLRFDFAWGSVNWQDDSRLQRHGWFSALLLDWHRNWAIPAIYGWYASGDDGNPANGSERLPSLDPGNSINFSRFAFDGAPYMERDALIGNSLAGTWGIGARISRLELGWNIWQILRVNYIQGTNSSEMARKMSQAGLWASGLTLDPAFGEQGFNLGMPGLYMTEKDRALELGTSMRYRQNESFSILLEAAYIFLWLDTGRDAWGSRHEKGLSIPSTGDAWNVNMTFVYSF